MKWLFATNTSNAKYVIHFHFKRHLKKIVNPQTESRIYLGDHESFLFTFDQRHNNQNHNQHFLIALDEYARITVLTQSTAAQKYFKFFDWAEAQLSDAIINSIYSIYSTIYYSDTSTAKKRRILLNTRRQLINWYDYY